MTRDPRPLGVGSLPSALDAMLTAVATGRKMPAPWVRNYVARVADDLSRYVADQKDPRVLWLLRDATADHETHRLLAGILEQAGAMVMMENPQGMLTMMVNHLAGDGASVPSPGGDAA